jgi:hypothetical protein
MVTLEVSEELHVTTRPVSVPPMLSLGVAVSCRVCPTVRVAVSGLTTTETTGTGTTRTTAVSFLSSAVTSIRAIPVVEVAVTRPSVPTRAIVVSKLRHVGVTVTPGSNTVVAVIARVCVTITLKVSGDSAIDCTPITVTAAVPFTPPALAVSVTGPRETAVT